MDQPPEPPPNVQIIKKLKQMIIYLFHTHSIQKNCKPLQTTKLKKLLLDPTRQVQTYTRISQVLTTLKQWSVIKNRKKGNFNFILSRVRKRSYDEKLGLVQVLSDIPIFLFCSKFSTST